MRSPSSRPREQTHTRLRIVRVALGAAWLTLSALGLGRAAAQTGASADSATTSPAQASADSAASNRIPARVEVLGVVHDANGGPVRGASVRVMSETDTVDVQSDVSGHFHARVTATRGVRVLVQAFGYRDLVRSFRAAGRPVIQAALALPPPYPLAGVTITAVPLPLRVNETSADVAILDTSRLA